jgi:hypothetical protein
MQVRLSAKPEAEVMKPRRAKWRDSCKEVGAAPAKRRGQVVVELLLILPIFLCLIFFIMETGYIAFQTIVTQHAAYEVARIGSMLGGALDPASAPSFNSGRARGHAQEQLTKMLRTAQITRFRQVKTLDDPQTDHSNSDLEVEVTNRVKLIFPGSSFAFATPKGSGVRMIKCSARMPIENPNKYTLR